MMTREGRLRVGAALMWASVLLAGVPAIVLTWLNDRSRLPLVLPLVGVCGLVAIVTTLRSWRRRPRGKAE